MKRTRRWLACIALVAMVAWLLAPLPSQGQNVVTPNTGSYRVLPKFVGGYLGGTFAGNPGNVITSPFMANPMLANPAAFNPMMTAGTWNPATMQYPNPMFQLQNSFNPFNPYANMNYSQAAFNPWNNNPFQMNSNPFLQFPQNSPFWQNNASFPNMQPNWQNWNQNAAWNNFFMNNANGGFGGNLGVLGANVGAFGNAGAFGFGAPVVGVGFNGVR